MGGFIKQDSGGEDMFVMPLQCTAFGGLPPIGTRVQYRIGLDQKTGQSRAEDVQPERVPAIVANTKVPRQPSPLNWSPQNTGTMDRHNHKGTFGFIKQDIGGEDMFVMPFQCEAFGGLPPIGTRVQFSIGVDPKTGGPRAENVQPSQARLIRPVKVASTTGSLDPNSWIGSPESVGSKCTGTMDREKGKFGFIKQDSGEEDMFVMPLQCVAFGGLPPIGARVQYRIGVDLKTGGPRAEDVQPEDMNPSTDESYGAIRSDGAVARQGQPY